MYLQLIKFIIVPQIKDMGTIEITKLETENAHRVLI
jgi:hypothetical protein